MKKALISSRVTTTHDIAAAMRGIQRTALS
jgi:hypothetical protein